MMKKREYGFNEEEKAGFFRLSPLTDVLFAVIFFIITYLILSSNFPGEPAYRVAISSLIQLLIVFFSFSIACMIAWIIKKVKR